jgi:hypothetical protein
MPAMLSGYPTGASRPWGAPTWSGEMDSARDQAPDHNALKSFRLKDPCQNGLASTAPRLKVGATLKSASQRGGVLPR